jgi:hypothetical protein
MTQVLAVVAVVFGVTAAAVVRRSSVVPLQSQSVQLAQQPRRPEGDLSAEGRVVSGAGSVARWRSCARDGPASTTPWLFACTSALTTASAVSSASAIAPAVDSNGLSSPTH